MFGTTLISFMEMLLVTLSIVVVLVVLAHTHKASLAVTSQLVHLFITPFEWLLHVVIHALEGLGGQIRTILQDIRDRHGDHEHAWVGWTIIASLFSMGFFLGLATCDFYNTLIKLGPIIGILVPYDPVLFSLSLGLSFVLAFLVIGWGIADVFGLSPTNMYKKLSDSEKYVLRRIMVCTMCLALLTTALLMILATEVRAGIDDTILFGFFLCLYSVLMLIATFIAGLSLLAAIASMYILVLGAVRLLIWLAGCLFYLPYRLLIVLHDLLVHLLDLLAKVGKIIWNKAAPKHSIDENNSFQLPIVDVLEIPHLTTASPSLTDEEKKGEMKELPSESVPPTDAA